MMKPRDPLFRAGRRVVLVAVCSCALTVGLGTSIQTASAQQPPPGGASPTVRPAANDTSPPAQADSLYRIGPGDVLAVQVFDYPQLSREAVRVDGRGFIQMPLIDGDIQAACRTENELAKELATRYLKYQRNPHVDIFVKEYNSQPVAVIGAVGKPGRFQIQRRVRLLELISLAGGPTDKAGRRIQIAHTGVGAMCNDAGIVAPSDDAIADLEIYNLYDTLLGATKSNPFIRPGDIITIPEAEQAFVVGNVFKPSIIPLKEAITVSQAVAMAGGLLPDTKTDRIRIIRKAIGDEKQSEILINLKEVRQHRAEDVMLQAGDIVDVPTSGGKKFLRNIISAFIPAVGNLPIYVLR